MKEDNLFRMINHFYYQMDSIHPERDDYLKIDAFLARASELNKDTLFPNSEELFERTVSYYESALLLDSNNYSANYNIGALYYNKTVELVDKMNYGMDYEELELKQEELYNLFKKSKPYLDKANRLRNEQK